MTDAPKSADCVSVPREPTEAAIEMISRLLAKVRGHSSADAIIDAEDGSRPAWTFYRDDAQAAYKLAQVDAVKSATIADKKMLALFSKLVADLRRHLDRYTLVKVDDAEIAFLESVVKTLASSPAAPGGEDGRVVALEKRLAEKIAQLRQPIVTEMLGKGIAKIAMDKHTADADLLEECRVVISAVHPSPSHERERALEAALKLTREYLRGNLLEGAVVLSEGPVIALGKYIDNALAKSAPAAGEAGLEILSSTHDFTTNGFVPKIATGATPQSVISEKDGLSSVEQLAKIIDPEAFGLPDNSEGGTITDRDTALDRARLILQQITTQPVIDGGAVRRARKAIGKILMANIRMRKFGPSNEVDEMAGVLADAALHAAFPQPKE